MLWKGPLVWGRGNDAQVGLPSETYNGTPPFGSKPCNRSLPPVGLSKTPKYPVELKLRGIDVIHITSNIKDFG